MKKILAIAVAGILFSTAAIAQRPVGNAERIAKQKKGTIGPNNNKTDNKQVEQRRSPDVTYTPEERERRKEYWKKHKKYRHDNGKHKGWYKQKHKKHKHHNENKQ